MSEPRPFRVQVSAVRWLPFALVGAALLPLLRALFGGETLFWGLPTLQFYPWREFAFAELRAGRLPAWNPYLGAGAPLLANYQTAIFYPPNWLMLVLPGPLAMSWVALAHVLWAALGTWRLAGALGAAPLGRGVSALSYALGGYLIARLGSFPTHNAAAWLPWLLWLTHRAVTRRTWRDAGALALAVGLLLLAGHAQTAWYGLLGAGAYALWRGAWADRRASWRARARGLALAGLGVALGAGIAAAQLIPTVEYLRQSDRSSGLDYSALTNLSYHPARLLTLLMPGFFGTPANGSTFTEGIFFEEAAYLGVIPLIAAGAALAAWLFKRHAPPARALVTVPFWAALALTGLFLAAGQYNPVFRSLYDHVPTFDAFREPVRWLILTHLGLALLAGIGVGHWGHGPRAVYWSRLAAAGGVGMALLALAAHTFADLTPSELNTMALAVAAFGGWIVAAALLTLLEPLTPAQKRSSLWRAAVLLVVTLDLAWFAAGLNPTVPASFFDRRQVAGPPGRIYWFDDYQYAVTFGTDEDETPPVEGFFDLGDYRIAGRRREELRVSLLPNLNLLDRVPSLDDNDPLLVAHHRRYVALVEELGAGAGALLRAAGVTRAFGVTPDGWSAATPAVAPGADGATAWLVAAAQWRASDEAISAALRDPAWDPAQTVILAGGEQSPPTPNPSPTRGEGPEGRVFLPSPLVGEGPGRGGENGNTTAEAASGSLTPVTALPAERRFHVTTDAPAYLVLAETWYPGWSATVNGAPAPILRANLAFQAVAVPAGESEVVFRYRINDFGGGAAISAGALIAALILLLGGRVRRGRNG
jgi:hypothetical protein